MDSLDFLKECPKGAATLSVLYTDGRLHHVGNLDVETIETVSPLLAFAFEETRSGPKHYLEDVTPTALASFLRFIFSSDGDYVPEDKKDDPCSMLLHTHVYRLADIYDIAELRTLARANLTRECEFSCSSCCPPLDLCEAINFVYQHLSKHEDIIDTLANYSVSMFLYHKLGEIQAFKDLAYQHRRFQQDLCMVNIKRGFVDDAALAIIQLPVKPFNRHHTNVIEGAILKDVLYDMWSVTDDEECQIGISKDRKVPRPASIPYRLRTRSPPPDEYQQGLQRTQLDLPTRRAIAEAFVAGTLSDTETKHFGNGFNGFENIHATEIESGKYTKVCRLPTSSKEEDTKAAKTPVRPFHSLTRAHDLTDTLLPMTAHPTVVNSLAIREGKRIRPKFRPLTGKGEFEWEDPSHRGSFVDESLADKSDDDGYVHVNPGAGSDSDSEWVAMEVD